MARSPDDVQVDVYPDVRWGEEGPAWQSAPETMAMADGGGTESVSEMVRGYGPQVGLAVLALVSLSMMVRIVRKSSHLITVGPSSPNVEELVGDEEVLKVGTKPVGQAAASESLLVGREVDDEALRYAELSEEVSKLVREDAEGAAAMIRRWTENLD